MLSPRQYSRYLNDLCRVIWLTTIQWVMGLGAIKVKHSYHSSSTVLIFEKTAWQRQTLKYGHEEGDKYSVLVFDNRGLFSQLSTSLNIKSLY
jgi:hypothetical protein